MQEAELVKQKLHINKIEDNKVVHKAGHTIKRHHQQAIQSLKGNYRQYL